ncbi:MarR family winged helix-turn-helix transcriptional regulator [Streptomyces sp. QTS52]
MTQRPIVETEQLVTEQLVKAKPGDVSIRHDQMAVAANIHRAASAVRRHVENSVLRGVDLTWTGFVVLWVVRISGETETRLVAEEAGISKGTLTGVARTLESRGLVRRIEHPSDGRRVLLGLTDEGEALMRTLFPDFNAEEARATADALPRIVVQVETHGEDRRLELLDGAEPAPRRSGRRPNG